MRNIGEKTGKGTCVIRHLVRGGDTEVGEGPSFQARLRPGQVVRWRDDDAAADMDEL